MKRVKGGTKVLRGVIQNNSYQNQENLIQLFDGKFTTGYKVVEFELTTTHPSSDIEIVGGLSTKPKSTISNWDFNDVEEIAWATWNAPTSSRPYNFSLIDPNNMVVEDMYVRAYVSPDTGSVNYFIKLEKYEFTAWDGAATMVRNQSQSGG